MSKLVRAEVNRVGNGSQREKGQDNRRQQDPDDKPIVHGLWCICAN